MNPIVSCGVIVRAEPQPVLSVQPDGGVAVVTVGPFVVEPLPVQRSSRGKYGHTRAGERQRAPRRPREA